MAKFINLTPRDITVMDHDGNELGHFPAQSKEITDSARVEFRRRKLDPIDGIPITVRTYREVVNLPPPEADTIYIVSRITAMRAQRADVVSPGTAVRDDDGNIIGCLGFHRIVWKWPLE